MCDALNPPATLPLAARASAKLSAKPKAKAKRPAKPIPRQKRSLTKAKRARLSAKRPTPAVLDSSDEDSPQLVPQAQRKKRKGE